MYDESASMPEDSLPTAEGEPPLSPEVLAIFHQQADRIAYGIYEGYKFAQISCEAPELAHLLPGKISVREVIEVAERIENGVQSDEDLKTLGRSFQGTFDYSRSSSRDPRRKYPALVDCVWWLQGVLEREVTLRLRRLIILAFWRCDVGGNPLIAAEQREIAQVLAEYKSQTPTS